LQTGFDYVQQELPQVKFVVTFDSDGQHLLSDLGNFRSAFQKNPDLEIALGSRFLGSTVNMPRSKKLVLKI
jgi:glycosyltransferase